MFLITYSTADVAASLSAAVASSSWSVDHYHAMMAWREIKLSAATAAPWRVITGTVPSD
jgi:hypothetical protein